MSMIFVKTVRIFSMETNHTTNYDSMHMIYISCGRRDICNYLKKHIEKEANKDD